MQHRENLGIQELIKRYELAKRAEGKSPKTIKGYTEMFIGGELGLVGDTQQRSLKVILKNVERLIGLIDQILQFRRLATAPLPRQLRPFPLGQLLADIEQNFRPLLREGQFDFRIDLPEQGVLVVADRHGLNGFSRTLFQMH